MERRRNGGQHTFRRVINERTRHRLTDRMRAQVTAVMSLVRLHILRGAWRFVIGSHRGHDVVRHPFAIPRRNRREGKEQDGDAQECDEEFFHSGRNCRLSVMA